MGSSVPSGRRGSACSGGGRRGRRTTRDDRSWRRTGEGTGGGEGGRGEARAHPELLERVRLPRGFPQQRREDEQTRSPSVCRFGARHARRLLHLLGRCEGVRRGVRRARQSARAGAICKTNARDDRGDGAAFRADPRGAAPGDRSTRRATARSRTRRDRGPRASPSAARGARIGVPRGGKKTKASRSFFARVGDARLPTPSSTRAPRAGAPNPPPPCCVGVPYIACRIARAATIAARALDAQ